MHTAVLDWEFRRFAELGKGLGGLIRGHLISGHGRHADGQKVIGSRHQTPYGSVNRTIQESLSEELLNYDGVEFRSPGKGKPKVLCVNGTLLVLWRYAKVADKGITQQRYGTSESRITTFHIKNSSSQRSFDLGFGSIDLLTTEEKELVEELRAFEEAEPRAYHSVVVVAYASNSKELFEAFWGDASINSDGTLQLENMRQLYKPETGQYPLTSTKRSFTDQPKRNLGLKPKLANEK